MQYLELEQRSRKAWSEAQLWHTVHREIYRYTMPARYSVDVQGASAPREYGSIFDATAVNAIDDFSSFVTEALYPFDAAWLRFVPRKDIPDEKRQKLIKLAEEFTLRVRFLFSTSNFHPAVFVANKDLAIGTKVLRCDPDPNYPERVWFTPIPPNSVAIEDDAFGRFNAIHTKVKASAASMMHRYKGGKFTEDFIKLANENPTAEVEFKECVSYDHEDRAWWFHVFQSFEQHASKDAPDFIVKSRYQTCPYIVTRWSKTPGMSWGVGPTYQCFADIRSANKVVEFVLKNAAIAVTGIWQAEDDGVLNPSNIRLVPGSIIPKASGSEGLTPLKPPGDFDVSQLVLNDLRANIKAAHFTTRLPEREMTAFEASERVRQMQRQLRGVFGQLNAEDVWPTVMRVIDVGRQSGVIPLERYEDVLDLELIGPLAQAVRESEANKVVKYVGTLAQIFGQEITFASLNVENIIPDIAEYMGVSRQYVKSKEELLQMRSNIEQSAAQIMGQQLNQPAGAAK